MRLNKFLALGGVAARRAADELITAGKVRVNGEVVVRLGTKINPDQDVVTVSGKRIIPEKRAVIYLLNKPCGVITSSRDQQGRKTVLDFVPKEPRVFPCGRLDEDTAGLVVLTNDGNLCYQLTHPKFAHKKEYRVVGRSNDPQKSWEKLQLPIMLKDGPIQPDKLVLNKMGRRKIDFNITIDEGRNRIVRRMCAAVGIEIHQLARVALGKYRLGNLLPGQYRLVDR